MLSGEFGNNLQKILRGWSVARLAREEFGLRSRLVFAEQRRNGRIMGKAVETTRSLKKCLSSPGFFRNGDFGLGNKLLDERYFRELDAAVLGEGFSLSDRYASIDDLRKNLGFLSDYLNLHHAATTTATATGNNETIPTTPEKDAVPRLMVRIDGLTVFSVVDHFYDAIRENFVFDEISCCGKTLDAPPSEHESVLHYRNFATEMKEHRRKQLGFLELSGKRLASEVFGHLREGDAIAIAGRNLGRDSENNQTEAFALVEALREKKLRVRISPGADSMEDFCFLKKARRELVGTVKSSYLQMAAYLGDADPGAPTKVARMYQYVTPGVVLVGREREVFEKTVGPNWTNPELSKRVRFEEYGYLNEEG